MGRESDAKKLTESLARQGVRFALLGEAAARSILAETADSFVDVSHRDAFLGEWRRSKRKTVNVDYARHLTGRVDGEASDAVLFSWLSSDARHDRVYRFGLRALDPVLELACSTLTPLAHSSWPGLFVELTAKRAVLITVDRFRLRYQARVGT